MSNGIAHEFLYGLLHGARTKRFVNTTSHQKLNGLCRNREIKTSGEAPPLPVYKHCPEALIRNTSRAMDAICRQTREGSQASPDSSREAGRTVAG